MEFQVALLVFWFDLTENLWLADPYIEKYAFQ